MVTVCRRTLERDPVRYGNMYTESQQPLFGQHHVPYRTVPHIPTIFSSCCCWMRCLLQRMIVSIVFSVPYCPSDDDKRSEPTEPNNCTVSGQKAITALKDYSTVKFRVWSMMATPSQITGTQPVSGQVGNVWCRGCLKAIKTDGDAIQHWNLVSALESNLEG